MFRSATQTHRRAFLRAAGISIALPILESLPIQLPGAAIALGKERTIPTPSVDGSPMRMVCVGNSLGFHPDAFFPESTGSNYRFSPILEPLAGMKKEMTIFSGLDHGLKGGHFVVHSFLSGVTSTDAKAMPDGNISLDQRAAETIAGQTRFPSLTVGSEDGIHGGSRMCWTRSGVRIPPITGPKELFQTLFVQESHAQQAEKLKRLELGSSILDSVLGDAHDLERRLGKKDQQKLEEYFNSVRDVEKKIQLRNQWVKVPKPSPAMKAPERDLGLVNDLPLLYDLIAIALQTDSTRIATMEIAGSFNSREFGYDEGYHGLSHHGHRPEKIEAVVKMGRYQVEQFAAFLQKLKSIETDQGNLLDSTMVMFGSGMGNANSHTNTNLPVILAGGGFRHGEHKAYENTGIRRMPLCNLYVSMLQRFGIETDRFGTSTGTLTGLELS
ncbi:Secreted protein containing DUF1552 [Planctomycetales bacterium 10988]|nr:Secreted protein containing DUF1552 [Planctomycetales bacterium 10988]